jgi:hypothetical protein
MYKVRSNTTEYTYDTYLQAVKAYVRLNHISAQVFRLYVNNVDVTDSIVYPLYLE